MLPPLLTRLFRPEPVGRPRTRLRAEALEAREVPASLVWTNATGDGMFWNSANWLNLSTGGSAAVGPSGGDDLYFDGDVSSANCNGIAWASMRLPTPTYSGGFVTATVTASDYNSVNLIDGYAGTVAATGGFNTRVLVVESGAIAQMYGSASEVLVSHTFLWTGGTLGGSHANPDDPNFAASNSTIRLLGGSTSVIDPGAGNAVAAGSTLTFDTANGLASTAVFRGGTVRFVGGAGVVVDSLSTVTAETGAATVTFTDTPQPGAAAKMIRVKAGGKVYVRGTGGENGGTFETAIPVMNYGLFQVERGATAVVKGAVPVGTPETHPSFYQDTDGAAIRIENGSRLVTEKGLSLIKGTLATLAAADPPQGSGQSAAVGGKVSLAGGHVFICEGTAPHVFGTLVFENDVWLGAVTLHVTVDGRPPGTGDAGKSDLFDFRGGLLDGLAQPVVKVATVNVPSGGLNKNQMWEFVKATQPIAAVKPTVVSETAGVNYQVMDVTQNTAWVFRPTA